MKPVVFALSLLALVVASVSARAAAFDHTYKRYALVLTNGVKEGRIDYREVSLRKSDLQRAIDEMAAVKESEFAAWSKARSVAYCVNLYNASAMLFVATNYPTTNVRALGSITESPWKMPLVPLFGRKVSLDHVQHEVLRRRLGDERHHFALVFGALGYPPARSEPYRPDTLDAQFADQARLFLNDGKNNQLDPKRNVLWLSPLFKWFAEDFTNRTDLATYLKPHFATNTLAQINAAIDAGAPLKVDFNDFDWTLNDTRKR